ncbi:MAG TPA: four helix bundle protein, partial [Chloroflexia bacterium]|nr:four helix bundle protein [Chloroflexia bacterium]
FYEYALGSAREARDWYYKARYILNDDVTTHRVNYLSEIIRLLLVMVPDQRGRVLKEDTIEYIIDPD